MDGPRFPRLDPAAAEYLEAIELPEAPWIDRAAGALEGPRVGDVLRAARTLAGCLAKHPASVLGTGVLEMVVELAGASEWAAHLLAADVGWALELASDAAAALGRPPTPLGPKTFRQGATLVRRTVSDTNAFEAEIRDLRTRESLRIALRELRGADLRETAAELSELAALCLQAALDHHHPKLVAEVGVPVPECRHVIIGLGKLGGRELNFSSDIDVIYVYEHDDGRAGELTTHQFHVRLFERVTQSLSQFTERGRVYRVDTDLRPEGRKGPLCNSLAGLERYYETWGRNWERAAWIKARPVAGDLELFDEVQRFARPFVYRRSRDLSVVEGVLDMKDRIDSQSRRRTLGPKGYDLKLGRGGIREIEFFVQAQQLLYGGRDPRLRSPGTLDALRALEVAGRVKAQDRERLADAYVLLRSVEHRVQLVDDRQTHAVPEGPAAESLAQTLGYAEAADLSADLETHTEVVKDLFRGLLGAVDDAPPVPPTAALLLDPNASEAECLDALKAEGATAPHTALAHLRSAGRSPRSPFHPSASARDARLAAQILAECLASPDLERALLHLPELVRSCLNHGAYLPQLERPDLRRGVARMLGASDLLARILVGSPRLLHGVLFVGKLPSYATLASSVDALVDAQDLEVTLERLRIAQKQEILRIAAAELAGALRPGEAASRLTTLAEVLIEACLSLALAEAETKYGLPEDPEATLVILGGGTLGAYELGYRSDVDLSAIYVGQGETSGGSRGRIGVREHYTRVVQRMLSFLTLRSANGDLYPVDMRLRPSGSQGALVTSLSNFETYHGQGRAQLWERQSLVRTRPVAGAGWLQAKVREALHRATYRSDHGSEGAEKIHAMRQRMARERIPAGSPRSLFHVKFGEGGVVEVEFLVQHLLLGHAGTIPGLASPSTRTALERLARHGLLSERSAVRLTQAHDRLRRALDWLRVQHDELLESVDLSPSALRPLALALGYEGPEAQAFLRRDLDADRATIRRAYERTLGL